MVTENLPKQAKKTSKLVFIIPLVIAVAGIAVYYWLQSRQYETTDNAQIDGNILSVRSGVTAFVDKIYFSDNQPVHQGDTLIRFNAVALQARVQQARAALANAQTGIIVSGSKASASVENASASRILAQSNQQAIVAARANLKRVEQELERSQKLLGIKALTQQQFEAARTQVEVAQATLTEAISRQQSSVATAQGQLATARSEQAQIGTAQALVEQRKAELTLAVDELRHAYVLAPSSGIVTKRAVQPGHFVSVGQSICAVVDTQHLWVSANVKETQLSAIRIGQQVEVEVDAYPNLRLTGHVASFEGATGAKFALMPPDNASGNFVKIVQRVPIRIALDSPTPAASQAPLYPGMSAFVQIKTR